MGSEESAPAVRAGRRRLKRCDRETAKHAAKLRHSLPRAIAIYPRAIICSRGLSELSGAFDSYVIAISADSSAISLIAILDSYRVAIAPTDELLS